MLERILKSMEKTFEIKGLTELKRKCKSFGDAYPTAVNIFMQMEARKNIKKQKSASPYETFRKGYFVKTKKKNVADIWKAVKNKAPHLHLVNDGHRMVTHSGVFTGKYVKGKHWTENVNKSFEQEFNQDLSNFLNDNWGAIKV